MATPRSATGMVYYNVMWDDDELLAAIPPSTPDTSPTTEGSSL